MTLILEQLAKLSFKKRCGQLERMVGNITGLCHRFWTLENPPYELPWYQTFLIVLGTIFGAAILIVLIYFLEDILRCK